MNPEISPLDQWLSEINASANAGNISWDPGFQAGRQIVISQLGPFQKVFQRPAAFQPRFYQKIYPLPVDEWHINSQIKLHGNFCVIDALITIRFQASVKYAQANLTCLPEINQHIKANCHSLVKDVIDQELRKLTNGEWIDSGLTLVERKIENQLNEALAFQSIQCRALCELLASFSDINDDSQLNASFTQENIYLKVLKKNFEAKELQNKERLRQESTLEQQNLDRQKRLLEQYNNEQELRRIEQEQSALNRKQQLEEQEKQVAEQLNIEQRIHQEQVYHEHHLKRMEQEAAAESQRITQQKQLEIEEQLLKERLEHQQKLKAIQLAAEIENFEKSQEAWNLTHEKLKLEKIEQEKRLKQLENEAQLAVLDIKQNEEHKLQERLLHEKMLHEARLKDMELEMQIQEHEKRYAATQQLDDYIRRDIELLILEKHRGELLQEVKKTKQEDIPFLTAPLPLDDSNETRGIDLS